MRLYCLIPNYVFEEKIANNPNRIGSIECDDFAGTYQDDFTYDLPDVLQYLDKEDWIENSICVFSTPAICKKFLNDENVMISFEQSGEDYIMLNKSAFLKFVFMKIMYEKRSSRALEIQDEEEFSKIEEQYQAFVESELSNITKPKDFYDSLIVVPHIDIPSVKAIYVLDSNRHALRASKQNKINLIVEQNHASNTQESQASNGVEQGE